LKDTALTVENGLSGKSLGTQYRPFRNIAVPLDQGRNRTTLADDGIEKIPDACRHFPVVAVDDTPVIVGSPGKVADELLASAE
jgi:hypothetical protein